MLPSALTRKYSYEDPRHEVRNQAAVRGPERQPHAAIGILFKRQLSRFTRREIGRPQVGMAAAVGDVDDLAVVRRH